MTSPSFTPHLVFGLDPMWVSVTVLAVTYAFIIVGRSNRAVVALIGAVIVILVGALDQGEAIKGIDWDTIGLLTGMMILVAISRRSGLFQYLAIWSAQRLKANPAGSCSCCRSRRQSFPGSSTMSVPSCWSYR